MPDFGDFIQNSDDSYNQKCVPLFMLLGGELEARLNGAVAELGLTHLQYIILHVLESKEDRKMTVNQISECLPTKVNTSLSISQLIKLGYVRKRRSEEDQRIVFVNITAKGSEIKGQADKLLQDLYTVNLPEDKAKELYDLFLLMLQNFAG